MASKLRAVGLSFALFTAVEATMRSNTLAGAFAAIAAIACPHGAIAAAGAAADGPLMRAALVSLEADLGKSSPAAPKTRTDWAPVTRLRPGGDVIVTVRGLPAATVRLLSVDGEGLNVLDTRDPRLPKDVRKTLAEVAADRPFVLLAARSGELQMARHIRATPAGIFFEERRLVDLADVIKTVPRAQVADIRVRRKHVGSHSRRGLIIGAGIGAAIGAAYASSEDEDLLLLMGGGAVFGGVYGVGLGTFAGILAPRSPDVIYHVD